MQLTTVFLGHLELLALLTFELFSLFRCLFLLVAGVTKSILYLESFHFQLKSTGQYTHNTLHITKTYRSH